MKDDKRNLEAILADPKVEDIHVAPDGSVSVPPGSKLEHEDLADAVLKRMGDLKEWDRTAAAAVIIAIVLERVIHDGIEACKEGGILALCSHAHRVAVASMDLEQNAVLVALIDEAIQKYGKRTQS